MPYDPTKPIDLSGVEGVTPEQQAYAENLVAMTVMRLPQWSDPAVAEAAGFHSIGDAATGHEHYVQWDWIDDDVWLDPDAPESLVYEPQPDGSKKLVSAMFMLPPPWRWPTCPTSAARSCSGTSTTTSAYTDDPVAPQVAGLTASRWHLPATAHQARPGGDDPRLDHATRLRPVRRAGGRRCRARSQRVEERWCDHAHGRRGPS